MGMGRRTIPSGESDNARTTRLLLFAVARDVVNSCDFTAPPGLEAAAARCPARQQLQRQIKQPLPPHKLQRPVGPMTSDGRRRLA